MNFYLQKAAQKAGGEVIPKEATGTGYLTVLTIRIGGISPGTHSPVIPILRLPKTQKKAIMCISINIPTECKTRDGDITVKEFFVSKYCGYLDNQKTD